MNNFKVSVDELDVEYPRLANQLEARFETFQPPRETPRERFPLALSSPLEIRLWTLIWDPSRKGVYGGLGGANDCWQESAVPPPSKRACRPLLICLRIRSEFYL